MYFAIINKELMNASQAAVENNWLHSVYTGTVEFQLHTTSKGVYKSLSSQPFSESKTMGRA